MLKRARVQGVRGAHREGMIVSGEKGAWPEIVWLMAQRHTQGGQMESEAVLKTEKISLKQMQKASWEL